MNSRWNRIAAAALGIVLLGTAIPAQAASLTTAQVSAIISLLQSFGADQTTVTNVETALGGTPQPAQSCVTLSHDLTLGSTGAATGGDVSALQNYLISKGYLPTGDNTGYYGYLTTSAVGQLQMSLGILSSTSDPAYGITGPATRNELSCNSAPTNETPVSSGTALSGTQPKITIDPSSLNTCSNQPVITGTAIDMDSIIVQIWIPSSPEITGQIKKWWTGGFVPVANGRWTFSTANSSDATTLPAGQYIIDVYRSDRNRDKLLPSLTATLNVVPACNQ